MDTFDKFVPLPGSEKSLPPDATPVDGLEADAVMDVTVRVCRKQAITPLVSSEALVPGRLSQSELTSEYGADPARMQQVEAFATAYDLTVAAHSLARRSVILRGTVSQMSRAFAVTLQNYQMADGQVFRGRSGAINVPTELLHSIEGVFGLDNRPLARPHFQVYDPAAQGGIVAHAGGTSFTPPQLAKLYNFPTGVTGKNQCIAIIELGGGFVSKDIKTYFQRLGLKTPVVKAISVDGGHNAPAPGNDADGEVMLDIEVAAGVAPDARIVVYFAPNTDQGFLDAITTALHDTQNNPTVVSISWGAAENKWTQQALTSFNQAFQSAAALGITICAAAGDTGSDDSVGDGKAHVDFPASSPFVLACGGTKLTASATGSIAAEVVWHESNTSATGGGISDAFAVPAYQQTSAIPVSANGDGRKGRGVPDVAAVADPATGYAVRVDGQDLVIGGTSAVAPLMAGLIALTNQQNGRSAGFIQPLLYANPAVCRDITQGDNITVTGNKGYKAAKGWDGCTGLGVPDGQQLARLFSATAPQAPAL